MTNPEPDKIILEVLRSNQQWLNLWNEGNRYFLLTLRINDKNETILHYAVQNCLIELVKLLLDFDKFSELLAADKNKRDPLTMDKLRSFIFVESTDGESALYQGLCKLDGPYLTTWRRQDTVACFFDTTWGLIDNPNIFVDKRVCHETTILHVLIEKEQVCLLEKFIKIKGIDFMLRDHRSRTPLMSAFETGNPSIIRIVYNHSPEPMRDRLVPKEFLECLPLREQPEFCADTSSYPFGIKTIESIRLKFFLKYKLMIVSPSGFIDFDLVIPKGHFFPRRTIELDCSCFTTIWLKYLFFAKVFQVPISKRDSYVNDVDKQIFIDRVNKKMSEKYVLVVVNAINYGKHFEQLNNFISRLPFNFKIIFFGAAKLTKFLKICAYSEYFPANLKYPDPDENLCLLDKYDVNSDYTVSHFLNRSFQSIDDSYNFEEIKKWKKGKRLSTLNNQKQQSLVFEKLGDFYANLAIDPKEAAFFYKKSLHSYLAQDDETPYAALLIKTGGTLVDTTNEDNWELAKSYFDKALEILNAAEADKLIAKCFEGLARYFRLKKQHDKGICMLVEALKLYARDEENAARVANHIFCAHGEAVEQAEAAKAAPQESLKYLDLSSKFYSTSSLDNVAMTFYNYGKAYENSESGHRVKAIDFYKQSIETFKQFYGGDQIVIIANANYNIGLICEDLEDFAAARQFYKEALRLFEAIYKCDNKNIAMVLNNLGSIEENSLNNINHLLESHKMYERLGIMEDVAMTAYNIGVEYLEIDQSDKSKEYFEKACTLYRELGDDSEVNNIESILLTSYINF